MLQQTISRVVVVSLVMPFVAFAMNPRASVGMST
jgi:hypothetical protein